MQFEHSKIQKGLFTFYLEQREQEDQLATFNRKKKKKYIPYEQSQQTRQNNPNHNKKDFSKQQSDRHLSFKFPNKDQKTKLNSQRKRLPQSIIDIGKNSSLQQCTIIQKPPPHSYRSRQLSVVVKATSPFKQSQSSIDITQQNLQTLPETSRKDFNCKFFKRHKKAHKLLRPILKEGMESSGKFGLQLPDIKSPERVRRESRPKKSVKNMLIQEALHSGDRRRIKQIRDYLRGDSPSMPGRENNSLPQDDLASSMRVFEYRQERLLQILKRAQERTIK